MTHLFLDFDETLFDHEAFVGFVAKNLESEGVATEQFVSSFNDYHDVQDDSGLLRLYRHRDHVSDKLGLEWDTYSESMLAAVTEQNADFCYPEVHEFLASLSGYDDVSVGLLTYGDKEYQTYKTQLCEHIRTLPITIVAEPKGEFLSREFAGANGILLDDKAPLNVPESWQHVWVNRSHKILDRHMAHKTVHSLDTEVLTGTYIS